MLKQNMRRKMVKFAKCEVVRNDSKVIVEQREKDVVVTNVVTDEVITLPNELLPGLSGLLEYIVGYQ